MSNVEALVGEWLTLPDVAEALNVKISRVHGFIDEGAVVALRIGEGKIRSIPAAFITEEGILDSLKGTVAVLKDSGFSDEEVITWLFTEDESLPGTPVQALLAGRKTEIRRRASALAW